MLTDGQVEPCKGSIALDSEGRIGLILSDDASRWDHDDNGNKVYGWDGIQLLPEVFGERWFCCKPQVLGHTSNIINVISNSVLGTSIMSKALDSIWSEMYPDISEENTWEYPGQVAAHVRCVFKEMNYEPGKTEKDNIKGSEDDGGSIKKEVAGDSK